MVRKTQPKNRRFVAKISRLRHFQYRCPRRRRDLAGSRGFIHRKSHPGGPISYSCAREMDASTEGVREKGNYRWTYLDALPPAVILLHGVPPGLVVFHLDPCRRRFAGRRRRGDVGLIPKPPTFQRRLGSRTLHCNCRHRNPPVEWMGMLNRSLLLRAQSQAKSGRMGKRCSSTFSTNNNAVEPFSEKGSGGARRVRVGWQAEQASMFLGRGTSESQQIGNNSQHSRTKNVPATNSRRT